MRSRTKIIILIGISLTAVLITLLSHFETSNETWNYWVFSRILSSTGKFNIIQRSPPYTLYLLLFRWFGFPNAITAEYIVTSLLTILGIVILFRRFLGLTLSFIAVFIWLPYMQFSEPPVQKIALATSCLAVYFRLKSNTRLNRSLSYFLMGLSFMFRPTFILIVPFFLIYDLLVWWKNTKNNKLKSLVPKLKYDWPILVVVSAYLLFQLLQSSHHWNNIFAATTTWFPQNPKSEEIIQNYNWAYIGEKYHTYVGRDFYFSNKELFGEARDTLSAIHNNPKYVVDHISIFLNQAIPMITKLTLAGSLYSHIPYKEFFDLIFLALILIGAILGSKNISMLLFILANFTITIVSIIFMPQYRYLFFSLIPLFIVSAHWYGQKAVKIITSFFGFKKIQIFLNYLSTALILVLFSPNFTGTNYNNRTYLDWISITRNVVYDYRKNDLKILDARSSPYNSSMRQSYDKIFPLIKNCNGVISLDYNFIAAFTDIPFDRIYDVWEIPPFGQLGDKSYTGLNPSRINCILISRELYLYEGFATNHQIRYENYIKPYASILESKGAASYEIPSYGKVVILEN